MTPLGITRREEKIGDIPVTVLTPDHPKGVLIFYHGWSSCRVNQVFRGGVFASYGYRVLLPEAIHHGDRGELDYDDRETAHRYFFPTVVNTIKEFPQIHELSQKEGALPVFLGGHSMGSIISGGILSRYDEPVGAAVFNGCWTYEAMAQGAGITLTPEEIALIREWDPIHRKTEMLKKVFYCGNGEIDTTVPKVLMEKFFREVVPEEDPDRKLEVFPGVPHKVTVQMMEGAIGFLERQMEKQK